MTDTELGQRARFMRTCNGRLLIFKQNSGDKKAPTTQFVEAELADGVAPASGSVALT
jgi:hypothetical protein